MDNLTRHQRRKLAALQRNQRTRQPYISDAVRLTGDLSPGTIATATVRHDQWCPRLRGGLCRCRPDVEVQR